jgi:YVTN family beta-propeller protein
LPLITTRIPVGLGPGSLRIVGPTLFVANQKDGTVSLIDLATDSVVKTTRVGDSPHGLAEEGSMVLVSNEASGTLTALSSAGEVLKTRDGADFIQLRTNPLDPSGRPQRIHVTKDGKRAYVPNEEANTVSVIDLASLTLIDTIPVGSAPTTLDISRGEVFVGNRDSHTVSVIAIQQDSAAATSTPVVTETPRPTRTPLPGETFTPTPDTGVAGAAATPAEGASPVPTDGAPDSEPIEPGLPVAASSATPTSTAGAGTPTAAPSRTAITGSLAPDSSAGGVAGETATPEALSASGGAPSWIWLAAALGVLAVLGAAGYAGRERIASYASRMRK